MQDPPEDQPRPVATVDFDDKILSANELLGVPVPGDKKLTLQRRQCDRGYRSRRC
jgi:hypothetical protein